MAEDNPGSKDASIFTAVSTQEGQSHEDTVTLGQDFELFPKGKIKTSNYGFNRYERTVYLIGDEGNVPLRLTIELRGINHAPPSPSSLESAYLPKYLRRHYITPVNPSSGYRIDEDDFDIEKRKVKLEKMYDFPADKDEAVLQLAVMSDQSALKELDLLDMGLVLPIEKTNPIKSEFVPLLSRLRLQVSFPSGVYELRPDEFELAMGQVDLSIAQKSGSPLPVLIDNSTSKYYKGMMLPSIAVPDPRSMRGIKGRFVMASEEMGQLRA